jgi:hypothetical protein
MWWSCFVERSASCVRFSKIDHDQGEFDSATVGPAALHRLTRPRVLLTALYHPEVFPLPRFPLTISDLARAARSTLTGHVEMMDMGLDLQRNRNAR